ncbi:MAG TPA: cell division protein FtsZ [Candidatus Paceibacterota bacterium]
MPRPIEREPQTTANIKVIGIGGSGLNAINHMIRMGVEGVEFIGMNTDSQDLHKSLANTKIHLGRNLTSGKGSGMNPDIGREAAEETRSEIQEVLKGADMVFIACGMGGGTGTGASPVIAREARDQGVLTVAVVTKPFNFEGKQRNSIADKGVEDLRKEVDAIIVIPNDQILEVIDEEKTLNDAFELCDEILRQTVEGISNIIITPGKINTDFRDFQAILTGAGSAFIGIGFAHGEHRAEEAARKAISTPLLNMSISGAKNVLYCITSGQDFRMTELNKISQIITESIDPNARVIYGQIMHSPDNLKELKEGEVKVTIIAAGFDAQKPAHSAKEHLHTPLKKEEPKHTPQQQTTIQVDQPKFDEEQPAQRSAKHDVTEIVVEEPSFGNTQNSASRFGGKLPPLLRRKPFNNE